MFTPTTTWKYWICRGLSLAAVYACAGCFPRLEPVVPGAPDADQDDRPAGPTTPGSTVLHALPPDLAALLNAPPVDAPLEGASALADTRWQGTQDCMLTGDYNMLISGLGTYPLGDSLSFDENGIPSEMKGLPYQFKRATFTADSFELAATVVMSTWLDEPASTAHVLTLSGRRSAGGQTLTGTRRWGVLYAFGGSTADLAVVYDCAFTLSRE